MGKPLDVLSIFHTIFEGGFILEKSKRNVHLFQSPVNVTIDGDIIYIETHARVLQSAPNNSNETYTFMCLGRAGRFGQC